MIKVQFHEYLTFTNFDPSLKKGHTQNLYN